MKTVYHSAEKDTHTFTQLHTLEMANVFINIQHLGIRHYQILRFHPTYFLKPRNRPFLSENAHPSCCQKHTPSAEAFSHG